MISIKNNPSAPRFTGVQEALANHGWTLRWQKKGVLYLFWPTGTSNPEDVIAATDLGTVIDTVRDIVYKEEMRTMGRRKL